MRFSTPFNSRSTADEVIPPSLAERFVDQQCAAGTRLRWIPYQGADHRSLIGPSSRFLLPLLRWTQARFDGETEGVSDCDRLAG